MHMCAHCRYNLVHWRYGSGALWDLWDRSVTLCFRWCRRSRTTRLFLKPDKFLNVVVILISKKTHFWYLIKCYTTLCSIANTYKNIFHTTCQFTYFTSHTIIVNPFKCQWISQSNGQICSLHWWRGHSIFKLFLYPTQNTPVVLLNLGQV